MRYYLAVAAALAMQVSATHAETIVALIGDDVLASVDTNTGKTAGLKKIDGVASLLGIDIRPADGQLYGLASDGTVVIIDPVSGKATPKSTLDMPPPAGVDVTVDFNPVADKMRIIGSDGTNLRVDVDSGKVTQDKPLNFAQTDPASGKTPAVIAGAYSNSVKGTKETTLYDIDGNLDTLFRQVPPNDGILNTIGTLGLDADNAGFDIVTDATGANTGMLVAKGNLYTVDLTSGKASMGKKLAGLPSDVRDIAVLPAPVAPAKAANADMMMQPDAMQMNAKGDSTAGYLPKAGMDMMAKPKAAAPVKTGFDGAKKTQMRTGYSGQGNAYSMPKAKRGPQCNNGPRS
jgi:hypothetical protein